MNEEKFKLSLINTINQGGSVFKLSPGCIYYILKDVLRETRDTYQQIINEEYQKEKQQQEEQQKEVEE